MDELDELDGDFEQNARDLAPEQFKRLSEIVRRVEEEKSGDTFQRKVSVMDDHEFTRLKDKLYR